MVKVSIIVPIYNLEKKLERCLCSLKEQTYHNLQVILIDDGSNDRSLEICKRFEEEDKRFQVLHHQNRGVSYTRNRGIECATGKYIMFVDGDDICLGDMVENYVKVAEQYCTDVVIGAIKIIEPDGSYLIKYPKIEGEIPQNIFWEHVCMDESGIYGYVPNKMYRLSLIRDNQIQFDEKITAQEDFAFALEVFNTCEEIYEISYYGYLYYHEENKRVILAENLLYNQIQMKEYAKKYNINVMCVNERIRKMVYVALFYSKSLQQISSIRNLEGLKDNIIVHREKKTEIDFILKNFLQNRVRFIYWYFKLRRILKIFVKRGQKG